VVNVEEAMRAPILVLPFLLSLVPAAGAADAEGCRDLPILPRLAGCEIRECRARDYDEAELQSGPVDASGDFPKAFVDGQLGVVTYTCPASLRLAEIARQAQAVLRRAGYSFVYSGQMFYNELPGFTARRGHTWVQLVSEPFDPLSGYTVTMVRANEVSVAPARPPSPRPSRR
jgi:hypothetical protein